MGKCPNMEIRSQTPLKYVKKCFLDCIVFLLIIAFKWALIQYQGSIFCPSNLKNAYFRDFGRKCPNMEIRAQTPLKFVKKKYFDWIVFLLIIAFKWALIQYQGSIFCRYIWVLPFFAFLGPLCVLHSCWIIQIFFIGHPTKEDGLSNSLPSVSQSVSPNPK